MFRLLVSAASGVVVLFATSCSDQRLDTKPQVAYGKPLVMGAAELKYSVLVLGKDKGCSGVAIGPRHVITATDCLGYFDGIPEQKIDVVSFAGSKPVMIRAVRAIRHPHEKVAWTGPFSLSVFVSSDVALLLLEENMETDGIKIAKPEQQLTEPLRVTGFGSDENDVTTGRPRTATSRAGWTGAILENGYGIVGFNKGDGIACAGDLGAPAVSGGFLVGTASTTSFKNAENPRNRKCSETESTILMDARLMRGWLKCSAAQLGVPLQQVSDAAADPWCEKNTVIGFNPGSP
jgi:hypothetical protein